VAALLLLQSPAPTGPAHAAESALVQRVQDGDTVVLEDSRRVRYLGINAPEFREPFSRKAKNFNESLVRGREVRLEPDAEGADAYGRMLAYVYVGDQLVNGRLVQEGLAHAFFIGPSRKHNALLLQLQGEAKQRGLGIWSTRGGPRDLKITSVHLLEPAMPEPLAPYVRIANLSNTRTRLDGYVLVSDAGHRYVFPDVSLDPGYTVIVANREGSDGLDSRNQLLVYWPTAQPVWNTRQGTALLVDPMGNLVDTLHYRAKRERRRSH
jgi:micrococcal nuclease